MAFHIPFEHRKQGTPIYIGFDAPRTVRPKKAWNWWAFFGFPFSLFALIFTLGILSPVALIFNLIALRKRPRKLATAGTIVSLIGSGLLATFIVGGVADQMHQHRSRERALTQRMERRNIKETNKLLTVATEELQEYRDDNSGYLPSDIDGCMLVLKHVDPWGSELRYEETLDFGIVRSAGPDKRFDSNDDVTRKVNGKTNRQVLLPVK